MWFNIRDISVSDRLRSRRRPGDRVAQAIFVDTNPVDRVAIGHFNPRMRDVPYDTPLRGNRFVRAEYFQFIGFPPAYFEVTGECELADGWSP